MEQIFAILTHTIPEPYINTESDSVQHNCKAILMPEEAEEAEEVKGIQLQAAGNAGEWSSESVGESRMNYHQPDYMDRLNEWDMSWT